MKKFNYDFSGYVTKNNIRCSDGRTICKNAFAECDGMVVPLVWNHQHDEPGNILGHTLLQNRADGVYGYSSLNNTDAAKGVAEQIKHGDITAMSIYANNLSQQGDNVIHGAIREVSLVLAGANPGAYIDSVIMHGYDSEEDAIIYTGEDISLNFEHSDEKNDDQEEQEEPTMAHADIKKNEEGVKMEKVGNDKTVQEVFDTLNEEQKTVVYALIGQAMDDQGNDEDEDEEEGDANMKHNIFESDEMKNTLSHSDMEAVFSDAKRYGSMKDAFLAHGISNIETLFPDAQTIENTPGFIKRDTGWVEKVMSGVHHTPFSRIKSIYANITADEARAKGYIKGNLKKEEVFTLLKRSTTPTTVYKKQKLDRDDIVDITSFDVIAWMKGEMRLMLDEELARAFILGDGRLSSSDDKINEGNIRPIVSDDDLYTIKYSIEETTSDAQKAKEFIKGAVKSRIDYKGSGSPSLYTTEEMITECLLIEDSTGRRLYNNITDLANAMRVKEIVAVPVMVGAKAKDGGNLLGVIVNLADYNVGADKGGAVNLFDDFDIDYNAMKYLIETRCSGALTIPYSAIAIQEPLSE